MAERPPIPAAIKREVRQRCGYGCVICGLPLYDYDHIVEWSETQEHTADGITLLCSEHHAKKTRGLLTRDQVATANADPVNVKNGITGPFGLDFRSSEPAMIVLGSNFYSWQGEFAAVMVDDVVTLGFRREGDELGLFLRLFNEFNEPELIIEDNILAINSGAWDIEFQGRALTVRKGPRKIAVRLRFEPPNRVHLERASMLYNGVHFDVDTSATKFTVGGSTLTMHGNMFEVPIGLKAGYCPMHGRVPSGISFPQVDRYGGKVTWAGDGAAEPRS